MRPLQITVDADTRLCGACKYRETGNPIGPICRLFFNDKGGGTLLDGPMRCDPCLAAESAAKPKPKPLDPPA